MRGNGDAVADAVADTDGTDADGTDAAVADVAVVGAGPAGMAAAVEAAAAGLTVALVDAGERPGGQYWRHGPHDGPHADGPSPGQHGRRTFAALRAGLARTGTRTLFGHQVWLVRREADRFTLHLRPTHDGRGPGTRTLTARSLILCPGAYDRQLPVPGWELPGVMAAGGVQALLKGSGTLAGRRAVVAGTGPFLLPVATGLAAAGAEVVMVCEANPLRGWLRDPGGALREPAKAVEGAQYAGLLARHGISYRTRTAVTEIRGEDRARSVRIAPLDRDGRPRSGVRIEVDADLVALGWGFTPSLELPLMVGARTRLDTDGSLVAVVDARQRAADVPGVYLAGEATGVGGAALAVREGRLSGLAAAADLGRAVDERRLRRLQRAIRRGRRFAAALHTACPVPLGWTDWLEPSTVICRCEEVTYHDLCHAARVLGAEDPRTLKMLARPGMGMCQGRVCGFATAQVAAALTGGSPRAPRYDLLPLARRPLATPVTLGEIAALGEEP
ncbi:FAD/NAD(P)-binding oxidoreductase [Streptomyces sp. ME19-01-6]|uniref:FAD/NAD(P)-binding oxidoreductase n=1 Tax=Streptomyces sp. ME19-01-6 TaxID=3028686 RepID=UPI0029BC5BE2|nr:FAD/NAD(P)-binding oxidoreductase [Streptomyces sp. ME19-01-6]MDX3232992.1 FAD/NAD(P)-binding oxidoreductase [Streptomyces sp. ME19-01-6]